MIKTFKELQEIDQIHARLLEDKEFPKTKLAYSFKRFTEKNLKKIFTDYNDQLQDNRIEHALVDEKTKAILYKTDGQSFMYDKEGLRAVLKANKETAEKWQDKEFEVEPFICTDTEYIEDLDLHKEEIELLKGVIL